MVVQDLGPRSTAVDRGRPVPTNFFGMFCTSQRLFYGCRSSGTPVDRGRPRSTGAHKFVLGCFAPPRDFFMVVEARGPRSTAVDRCPRISFWMFCTSQRLFYGCTSSGTPVDRGGRPVPTNFFGMFCTSQRLFYGCRSSGTPVDRGRPRSTGAHGALGPRSTR